MLEVSDWYSAGYSYGTPCESGAGGVNEQLVFFFSVFCTADKCYLCY